MIFNSKIHNLLLLIYLICSPANALDDDFFAKTTSKSTQYDRDLDTARNNPEQFRREVLEGRDRCAGPTEIPPGSVSDGYAIVGGPCAWNVRPRGTKVSVEETTKFADRGTGDCNQPANIPSGMCAVGGGNVGNGKCSWTIIPCNR
jgi:hypothetical protein